MRQMHKRVFDDVRKAAPDDETVRCIDGFAMMSERLHSDDRMHWRIWRWCQKDCIQRWNDWMHWRVFDFACYQTVKLQTIDDNDDVNWKCELYVISIDLSDLFGWLTNRLIDQIDRLICKSNRLNNIDKLIDFSIDWLVRSTNWLINNLHDSSTDIWLFDRCVAKRVAFTYEIEFIRWMHWRIFFLTGWWRKWTKIVLLIIFSSFVRFHCLQTIFYVHRRHFFAFSDRFELYDRIRKFSYFCKTRIWLI